MSWEPETVVIYGYRVPREMWQDIFEYCEQNYTDDDQRIPDDWEDYFIDMDPACGQGETLFGKVVHSFSDDDIELKEFDSLLVDLNTIRAVEHTFDVVVRPVYENKQKSAPRANKYIGMRYI